MHPPIVRVETSWKDDNICMTSNPGEMDAATKLKESLTKQESAQKIPKLELDQSMDTNGNL